VTAATTSAKAVDIREMARRIRDWTRMGSRSFGTYLGINDAIRTATDKSLSAAHHAHALGQDLVLLSVIRIFAVMDKDAEVGLQPAYRFLTSDGAFEHVVSLYHAGDHPSLRPMAEKTCSGSIDRFLVDYRSMDWKAFGKLQRFRNGAIAHISRQELESSITYDQFENIVRRCGRLSGELSLMTSGLNSWPEEDLRDATDDARRFWSTVFAEASKDTVAWHLGGENGKMRASLLP